VESNSRLLIPAGGVALRSVSGLDVVVFVGRAVPVSPGGVNGPAIAQSRQRTSRKELGRTGGRSGECSHQKRKGNGIKEWYFGALIRFGLGQWLRSGSLARGLGGLLAGPDGELKFRSNESHDSRRPSSHNGVAFHCSAPVVVGRRFRGFPRKEESERSIEQLRRHCLDWTERIRREPGPSASRCRCVRTPAYLSGLLVVHLRNAAIRIDPSTGLGQPPPPPLRRPAAAALSMVSTFSTSAQPFAFCSLGHPFQTFCAF
jgi:hypothetical protein